MTKEQSFVSADHIDLEPFMSSQTGERTLNAAIVRANISESFEEYLEIFDAFYADDIEVISEPWKNQSVERKECAHFSSISLQFPSPASRNGRNRWPFDIHPTDRNSWRYCRRDAFRADARLGRGVRQKLHCNLAGPAEMERVAGSVRASL